MTSNSGTLRLKQGPGPLTYLELQDVIDRLENRIIALERDNTRQKRELSTMNKKIREMEMHVRQLGRATSRRR
jgi:chaperonin cofactor prefoldin